jgi:hypothetical protein
VGRKRTCELPFCKGVVEGTRNKRRCDNDRNIHLHQIISKNVKRIMRYIEGLADFTANDVNKALFKDKLDKNEKGSMYRLFQAMIREGYITEHGKRSGLKVYAVSEEVKAKKTKALDKKAETEAPAEKTPAETPKTPVTVVSAPPAPPQPAEPKLSPEQILLGKLKEFVYLKNGQWNHPDWIELINRPDIKEFGLSEEDIGRLLEEEKSSYWAIRNG